MNKKNTDFWKKVVIPCSLLLIFFVTLGLIRNEFWSTILILVFITATVILKYHKREWILLLTGTVVGAVLEIGGDLLYKMQQWSSGSFFGIPLWLPLMFGFGFLLVYRIGDAIIHKQSK